MPCTTLLVGRNASYDGSTIVARNDDDSAGSFTPKHLKIISPEQQPRTYRSVISHLTLELPQDPLRYSAVPNALEGEGIWAAAGINAAGVGMSATETISCNPRVLAADPLVEYAPAQGTPGTTGYVAEQPGGLGEEDFVVVVLPYIRTAREGVLRLGELLERYGTYETNGIAFHDSEEIWWLETIGGHHWIARRVPDDAYVTMPNQLGIDRFDLEDALGAGVEYLCSADLASFMEDHHLDLTLRHGTDARPRVFNPREAFGTATDSDHVYNTPRAWAMQRHLNPHACVWDGPGAEFSPTSDDIPWCRVPERKITMEDVKYVESIHYQATPYDPYGRPSSPDLRGIYRPIGVNRTSVCCATQIRGDACGYDAIEWFAFGSNVHNSFVPLFAQVDGIPAYFATTGENVSTESFYWTNRLIGALADASWKISQVHVERYQGDVVASCWRVIEQTCETEGSREAANERIAQIVREKTDALLSKVLYECSNQMTNGFSRSDH